MVHQSFKLFSNSLCVDREFFSRGFKVFVLLLLFFSDFTKAATSYDDARKLMRNNQWIEAEGAFKELLREAPHSQLLNHDYSKILLRLNRRKEAISLLKRLGDWPSILTFGELFLNEDSKRGFQEGFVSLTKNQIQHGIEKLEAAHEIDLGHRDILFRLAEGYGLKGDWKKAKEELDLIEKLYGGEAAKNLYPLERLWLGRAYTFSEEPSKCRNYLIDIQKLLPELEDAALWTKDCYLKLNLIGEAKALLNERIRFNPNWTLVRIAALELDPKIKGSQNHIDTARNGLKEMLLRPNPESVLEVFGKHIRLTDYKLVEQNLKKFELNAGESL